MREQFPLYRPGNVLRASEVSKLSRLASRLAKSKNGNRQATRHTSSILSSSDPPTWLQSIVQVTDDEDSDEGLYKVKLRYWDKSSKTWELRGKEWDLDASDLDMELAVDDKVVAFWDVLRGMFVPMAGGATSGLSTAIEFTLTEVLLTTDENKMANVYKYYNGTNPGDANPYNLVTVHNKKTSEDYMFEGGLGAMGMAKYNEVEEIYVIWNMQC